MRDPALYTDDFGRLIKGAFVHIVLKHLAHQGCGIVEFNVPLDTV